MIVQDQYRWWRAALAGTPIDSERGNPRSGFFKKDGSKGVEAVAIWRENDGRLQCLRTIYGDGSKMTDDEIDELYGSVSRYPIEEADFFRAYNGEALGPEFATRLTLKEIQAGVVWTPALGRKKLGAGVKAADDDMPANPRERIGANNPPPDDHPAGHKIDGEQTPDKLAFAEASELGAEVKRWLDSIGGKPRNEEERATIADYKTKFSRLHDKADKDRLAEKRPHLDAEKEIDGRWKRVTSFAATSRDRCGEIYAAATKDEEDRRKADAAKTGEQANPVESVGHLRSVPLKERELFVVLNTRLYVEHLMKQDGELPAEIVEAASKVAQRRAEPAPGVERRTERKAA